MLLLLLLLGEYRAGVVKVRQGEGATAAHHRAVQEEDDCAGIRRQGEGRE
jgi:hypothetical protein